MILEFGVLSRLTGDPIYEDKARHAMVFIYNQRSVKSMVGTGLSTDTGEWSNPSAGVGASIDSYYEYLLKSYLMFGEKEYLDMFVDLYSSNRAYSALSEAVGGMVCASACTHAAGIAHSSAQLPWQRCVRRLRCVFVWWHLRWRR